MDGFMGELNRPVMPTPENLLAAWLKASAESHREPVIEEVRKMLARAEDWQALGRFSAF